MTVFPARTTKTLPSPVATSSCVSALSPVLISSAAASSPPAARASSSARGESARVDAATLPWSSNTTAAWICEEISVRSASACWASIVDGSIEVSLATPTRGGRGGSATAAVDEILQPHADSATGFGAEVLRRPRPAPGRDDRLLRASLLRSADLSLSCPPRPDRTRGRVFVPRQGDQEDASGDADRPDRQPRARRPGQRGCPRQRRR